MEQYSVSGLWEIEIDRFEERGAPLKVYSREKNDDIQKYRLRHLMTGQVIYYTENGPRLEDVSETSDQAHNSWVFFHPTVYSKFPYIKDSQCFNIGIKGKIYIL